MMNLAQQEIAWRNELAKFREDNQTDQDAGIVVDYVTYYPTGAVLLEEGACNRIQDPEEESLERLENQYFYWDVRLESARQEFLSLRNEAQTEIREHGRFSCEAELEALEKEVRRLKRKLNKVEKAIDNHPETIAADEKEARAAEIEAWREEQRSQAFDRLNQYRI